MRKLIFIGYMFIMLPVFLKAQIDVLTQHNDLARTGANLREKLLNVKNVDSSQFGLLFSHTIDDQEYTQPLIVGHLMMPKVGPVNVVFAATVNNTVYAFDADNPNRTSPYWQVNFTPSGTKVPKNTDMTGACGGYYQDFSGKIGIVGTPFIDTATFTMYFVSRDINSSSKFEQWFHAIDIRTGYERQYSPVKINAKYYGNGDGNVNDTIYFDSQRANQRAGITLVKGVVYITWSSHCDWGPYHGWIIGYDAKSLAQKCVWMDNANGYNAGIWMSGQGITSDEQGNLYVSTGNGSVGYNGDLANTINRGESFIKLKPAGNTLKVESFFTPADWQKLEDNDMDLGTSGIMLIPGTKWAISGGKEGVVYLVNRDTMGGVDTNDNILQEIPFGEWCEHHVGPVVWQSDSGEFIYFWPVSQYSYQYKLNVAKKKLDYYAYGKDYVSGHPGGILSISADGSKVGSGILWATAPYSGDAIHQTQPGILRAYDAANISIEIWNSNLKSKDSSGGLAKFVPPTVANGKVYVATFSGSLNVYGIAPPNDSFIVSDSAGCSPVSVSFTNETDTSKIKLKSWFWDFGDGTLSNSWNASHTFTKSGNYYVTFYDTASGSARQFSKLISVYSPTAIAFSVNNSGQCLYGNQFTFSEPTNSIVKSVSWDFGDGTATASTDTVSHSYNSAGTYKVVLTSTSVYGCIDTISSTVVVYPTPSGVDFTVNDTAECKFGNTPVFTNTTTSTDSIITYYWSFGDGFTSNSKKPVHAYRKPGNYTVSLYVATIHGCTDSIKKTTHVFPVLLGTNFTVNDSAQCFKDNSFLFSNTSKPNDSNITGYSWDFGDSSKGATVNNPSHSYLAPGYYNVSLTMTSVYGCMNRFTEKVHVLPNLNKVNFNVNDSIQCLAGNTFVFSDTALTHNSSYIRDWSFGDGSYSTSLSPIHSYKYSGYYNTSLKISQKGGCDDSVTKTMFVSPPLTGYISGDTAVKQGDTSLYTFIPSDTSGKINNWDFTGGSRYTASLNNIKIIWQQSGKQLIAAHAGNSSGCTDSAILKVNVQSINGVQKVGAPFRNVQISPNPNSGSFLLTLTNDQAQDIMITIYNALGRQVYRHIDTNYKGAYSRKITLKNKGVYILDIKGNYGEANLKVIVQ